MTKCSSRVDLTQQMLKIELTDKIKAFITGKSVLKMSLLHYNTVGTNIILDF